jgi:release factor glutamine methyltransferase
MPVHLTAALAAAVDQLEDAGVASPNFDARELLAHVLKWERSYLVHQLMLDPAQHVSTNQAHQYQQLVEKRAQRVPLQHLTGRAAFRQIEVEVGPGVFVPRPETELLAGWIIDRAKNHDAPVIVDLCTGSGVIAKAVKYEVPSADIYAVELDPPAHQWATKNLAGLDIQLFQADALTALPELNGVVDLLLVNPPYIPLEAWESVAPEARDHDPHLALFSGKDGLDFIRKLEVRARTLLRPGGELGVEHADVQGEAVVHIFATTGWWQVALGL